MPALPQSSGASGGAEPAQPGSLDDERVDVLLANLDPERADDAESRLGVARAAPVRDARLAFGERTDQEGPMRDGLVAGDRDVAVEAGGGRDPHSITGETTTP